MARNRLTKIGTIHSRTVGLLKSGAMKEEDKPLWFELYEAFPPKDEPRFDRTVSKLPIRDIFYKEDVIRARYHKDNPSLPWVRLDDEKPSQTQRFIEAYQQLKKSGMAESDLYSAAVSLASLSPSAPTTTKPEKPAQTTNPSDEDKTKRTGIKLDISRLFQSE